MSETKEAPIVRNLDEYQHVIASLENKKLNEHQRAMANGLGLGEIGEVQGIVKKHVFHEHALDVHHLLAELGDVLWYIATESRRRGLSLNEQTRFLATPMWSGTDQDCLVFHALQLGRLGTLQGLLGHYGIYDQEVDNAHVRTLFMEALFHIHEIAHTLNSSLLEIAQGNVEKLWKRYPNGFSPEASIARVDVVEDPVREFQEGWDV